ncbi:MAG: endonuclease domain-containing protein [Bacteroidota bacterium]|nr:endonuclease domain-containing protein [Bacteroidota bacterium]
MKGPLPFHHGAGKGTKEFAKHLRQRETSAEDLFWKMARNRKILNLKIRRQHPIGIYIADFYCHELKLVIELDGSIHDLEHVKQKDKVREAFLISEGLKIMRFSNDDVFANPHLIEEAIKKIMK